VAESLAVLKCAGLVNLVNPAVIVIAGGVAHAGELLLEPIRGAIVTRSLSIASSQTRVLVAELGDNAIALGGVVTVLEAAFGVSAPGSDYSNPLPLAFSAGLRARAIYAGSAAEAGGQSGSARHVAQASP